MNEEFEREVRKAFEEYLNKFLFSSRDNVQKNTLWAFYLEGYNAGLAKAAKVIGQQS